MIPIQRRLKRRLRVSEVHLVANTTFESILVIWYQLWFHCHIIFVPAKHYYYDWKCDDTFGTVEFNRPRVSSLIQIDLQHATATTTVHTIFWYSSSLFHQLQYNHFKFSLDARY
mgnify:FL=1